MSNRIFQVSLLVYFSILIFLFLTCRQPQSQLSQLKQLNNRTTQILQQLVKTKYFRLLRLNLNSQCPLPLMNKLCKQKSCSVCRCDEKDIPQNWMTTDKVQSTDKNKDVWSKERDEQGREWVWHVEDQENDKGEYFDVNVNVESYSGYNGSYIWSLIYEENCFQGANHFQEMCLEEQVLYKIISGLHTSISSHLSRLYKNITKIAVWADKGDDSFFFNHKEYQQRVLSHPDRIKNLLFLYEILLRSTQAMIPNLESYIISSDNIAQDLQATKLLAELLKQIKKQNFKNLNETDTFFFYPTNPHVKQYQRYIHNISSILNCVECQKCRLFGKMQTYGLGTALKILLGYNNKYKRNELVAMFNTLNKISISVNTYFNYGQFVSKQQYENVYSNVEQKTDELIYVKIWGYCGLILVAFAYVIQNWNGKGKVKRQFKHAFPPGGSKARRE